MMVVGGVKGFLLETAAVTTASTVILSAVGWFLTPRIKAFVWATVSGDTTMYDKLRVESFGRQTAAGKEAVRLMLIDELAALKTLSDDVDDHGDRLKRLDISVLEQGRAIQQLPLIANAMESSAASVKDIARTMREIHTEVSDHGRRLERWDGYFEGQRDSEEGARRHRKRRHDDNEPDDV